MRIWRPRPLDDGAKTQLLEFWRICAPRVLKGQYCKAGIFNIISQKSFPEKKAGSRAFDKARLPRFAWRLLSPASQSSQANLLSFITLLSQSQYVRPRRSNIRRSNTLILTLLLKKEIAELSFVFFQLCATCFYKLLISFWA